MTTRQDETPNAIPTDPFALAELLAQRDDLGALLYDQLVEQEGRDRADRVWQEAEREREHRLQVEQALTELTGGISGALASVRKASTALTSLTAGHGWHVEYAETTVGDDITAHLADAARNLRAAAALHEQAQP
jgi:hypothetical protein